MKKLYFLMSILLLTAGFASKAQTLTCNADFSFQVSNGNFVQFTSLAPGDSINTSNYWRFGDGLNGSGPFPTHTYQSAGVYNVTHIQYRHNSPGTVVCVDSMMRQVQITSPTVCNLVANFNQYRDSSAPNLFSFYFVNTSVNVSSNDSIRWTFGDGTSSNQFNTYHSYSQPGTYNACLRIIRRGLNGVLTNCISEICHAITIPINTCNLVASFTPYRDSLNTIPYSWYFYNTSVNASLNDSIRWTFGDGTSSNQYNAHHSYAQAGTYTVCLRIIRRTSTGLTNCVSDVCHTIIVQQACNLQAAFVPYRDSLNSIPYSWYFYNTSINASPNDSIRWTFGDGTSSNQYNAHHSYAQAGAYNVCLRIIKRNSTGGLTNCVSEVCHTVYIQTIACNLVAAFTPIKDSLNPVPYSWYFYNTSLNASPNDSIRWTFGDGTSSNQFNAHHSYAQAGTYNVCLRIIKRLSGGILSNCVSEVCHIVYAQQPCNLVASFYSVRDSSSTTPYRWHFINTSQNLATTDSIRWTFGDGTSSNQYSPYHSYAQPGTYTVCLRILKRTAAGTTYCVSEVCHTIIISPVCNLQPHFTWRADSLQPRKIYFTNTTIVSNANAYANWSFGDGTTSSSWNALHEYAQPGRYRVCLVVYISNTCVASYCDSITVQPTPVSCIEQSQFTITRVTNDPNLVYFTPLHINNDWLYTWTFGDGTGSHDKIVSHRYPAGGGNYTACLTVYRNPSCASTTCKPITVLNCLQLYAGFTYYRDSPAVNRVHFNAFSNGTIVSQQWIITKRVSTVGYPIILNQNNPVYTFTDTGYYRVCLRATLSNGCVKEYCQEIYIHAVVATNVCNLQIFPNPATTQINAVVQLAVPQMIDVYIYNMLNVMVREKHQPGVAGSNTVTVSIGDLPAGMYRLTLIHGNDLCNALFQKL